MPVQGLQFTILNGREAHQSYQATGSFVVYNPNDGVALVATDRTATGLSWDYKVPSQSGGKFPGPINSYLSIFYLDQSGTGGSGQVVVYASTETVNIPYFWSIGRALQGQVTSLDVVEGTQPGNPGAGIARLWVDGSGHLHILESTGVDRTVIDSLNWGTIPLGGDLTGTTGNAFIRYRVNGGAQVLDAGSNVRNHVTFGGETLWWAGPGGGFRWVNQGNSVEWMRLDTGGGLTVANQVSAPSFNVLSNVIYWNNNSSVYLQYDVANNRHVFNADLLVGGSGVTNSAWAAAFRFGSVGASYYLSQSGGNLNCVNMNVVSWGDICFAANTGVYLAYDGNQTSGGSIPAGGIYSFAGIEAWGQIYAMRGWGGTLGNTNAFLTPNIGDYRGQGLAQSWSTWASVDHAIEYGLMHEIVKEPLKILNAISGYHYEHTHFGEDGPMRREDGSIIATPTYGFKASEVAEFLPELVGFNPKTGEPEAVDIDRLAVILWQSLKEINTRLSRLEKQEQ